MPEKPVCALALLIVTRSPVRGWVRLNSRLQISAIEAFVF